jgi:hypothetical protein
MPIALQRSRLSGIWRSFRNFTVNSSNVAGKGSTAMEAGSAMEPAGRGDVSARAAAMAEEPSFLASGAPASFRDRRAVPATNEIRTRAAAAGSASLRSADFGTPAIGRVWSDV